MATTEDTGTSTITGPTEGRHYLWRCSSPAGELTAGLDRLAAQGEVREGSNLQV